MTYDEYCQRRADLCNAHMEGRISAWEFSNKLSVLACAFAGIPS